MKLSEIINSIYINDNRINFTGSEKKFEIIVEYINDFFSIDDLEKEIDVLQRLQSLQTEELYSFIMTELYGFMEFNRSSVALVGGSFDFSCRLLYKLDTKECIIQPIYSREDVFYIKGEFLIRILKDILCIYKLLL